MTENLEPLVVALLDACVELRKEVAALPAAKQSEAELVRFAILEEIRRASPAPEEVRWRLVLRARIVFGHEFADWVDAGLVRGEMVPPISQKWLVGMTG